MLRAVLSHSEEPIRGSQVRRESSSGIMNTKVPWFMYATVCEVCCRPIEISYAIEDASLVEFKARRNA